MKLNVYTLKQQTQDFVLRLFVEPSSEIGTSPSISDCTGTRCGTFMRLQRARRHPGISL